LEEFVNLLDIARFESTNSPWNESMLNDPWSVGYVTTLIEMSDFHSKEEWEAFYYRSGEERLTKLNALQENERNILLDDRLQLTNRSMIHSLSWNLKNLNYNYGRTEIELAAKGRILFEAARKRELSITEDECTEAVRFRTICQTWNGIIIRERNTIKLLKQRFSNVEFRSTKGEFDHKYAVDHELLNGGKLICGIQVKPKSYLGKAPHLVKAQQANTRKNAAYQRAFSVQALTVISKPNGEVLNPEVVDSISQLVNE
jgi:hypothetical protein